MQSLLIGSYASKLHTQANNTEPNQIKWVETANIIKARIELNKMYNSLPKDSLLYKYINNNCK
jgi:hypothetical protein